MIHAARRLLLPEGKCSMKGMMFTIVGSRTHLLGFFIAHEAQLTGLACSQYHVALCAQVTECKQRKAAMRDADASRQMLVYREGK